MNIMKPLRVNNMETILSLMPFRVYAWIGLTGFAFVGMVEINRVMLFIRKHLRCLNNFYMLKECKDAKKTGK